MRFECRYPALYVDKFWTFEIQDGNRVGFAYGRRGTAGQTMVKTYATLGRLTEDLERLVREKLEKGYLPVENDGNPAQNIEVFGIRMQLSIRAAMRRGGRIRDIGHVRLLLERFTDGRVQMQQPGRFDPLRGPVGAPCPHANLVRGALGYLCDACGESLPAGPGAAPTEGILVAVKTKRRITFE